MQPPLELNDCLIDLGDLFDKVVSLFPEMFENLG